MRDETGGQLHSPNDLVGEVYAELRAIAASYLREERVEHTLQPTALVHEAWMRVAGQDRARWQDAEHFRAVASTVMRRVLVDHARQHGAIKRGGGAHAATLIPMGEGARSDPVDVIVLDEALQRLEKMDPRQARIVELRFFGGFTNEQVSNLLELSVRTVQREWISARTWLFTYLAGHADGATNPPPITDADTNA